MVSRQSELRLAQFWRKTTHVRRFHAAVRDPLLAQTQKLMSILRANEKSQFGKKHNFDKIHSVAEFQSRVPSCDYEDLRAYVEAAMEGERNQLTMEQPFMFALTSGTTAKPKFIPVTKSHLSDYTHAFHLHNYHLIEDYPEEAANGTFLIISSNDEEGHVPSGAPYGAISGLLNRRQSPLVSKYFAVPSQLSQIKDVDTKYYLMLRIALAQKITAILCCNPSSLLLLADQLNAHSQDLIADIHQGTIKSCYQPAQNLIESFSKYLTPNPGRAQELTRLIENHGMLQPRLTWPELGILSCWKGGPMSFYLEQLPKSFGNVPIRDFGYMASEGRGSIPISNDGAGGVTALTSHFFEFVAEEENDSTNPKFLTLNQLTLHRRYFIFFTTSSGLYRYNINDLIEVVGFYQRTPVIQFVRKGAGISSISGEKLTEEQVKVAVDLAIRQLKLSQISHFTAAVQLGNPPSYVCFAELSGRISEPVQQEFLRIFEQSLRAQNPEYENKRLTTRLGPPSFKIIPVGTFTGLRQERVSKGAPEAQVKIPLLSCTQELSVKLAALSVGVHV